MIGILKKIDLFLLPRNLAEQFSPYVWLIYLPLFVAPVVIFHNEPIHLVWTALATIVFLGLYFHAFWVKPNTVIFHIIGILLLATAVTFYTPSSTTLFIYAAAFCGRLKPIKYSFAALVGILIWEALLSWLYMPQLYFYIPTIVFSLIIGVLNIYQFALHEKRQELLVSRQETQRLAKVAERERIARDLHDLIGHTFSVITLKADLAGRLLDKNVEQARAEIKQLEDISRDALSQVREVVSGYRTSDLLSELANAKNVFTSLNTHFEYRFDGLAEQDIPVDTFGNKELAIVLRELVTNIVKHAKATHVEAIVKLEDGNLVLEMKDNGRGFECQVNTGFGIKGIEERIMKLSGFVDIQSGKGYTGTLSRIGIPVLEGK